MSDNYKKKKINLRSEELFHIAGVTVLNTDAEEFKKKFEKYDRSKNSHEIVLTTHDLEILINLYKKHSNQKGLTIRIQAKLEMLLNLIDNDVKWETNKNNIMDMYKKLAKKSVEDDLKNMEIK